jgi:2-oxoglutarate ferredoxin oxidoreductase subunit alpha
MQARWGASGDYQIIALSPWSVEEAYTETIRAFNLAERFRLPVSLLTEEAVGHLRENVDVPAETRIYNRIRPQDREPPFGRAEVPPMPAFGQGHKLLVTGSTHDEWGYRRTSSAQAQENLVTRLSTKVINHLDEIIEVEEYFCDEDELDILVIAFGFTARSAWRAVKTVRQEGTRAGLLRLKTVWPFPEETVRQLALRSRAVLVPEMNRGQVLREVQRVAPQAQGYNKTDGEVIVPEEIWQAMQEVMRS